MCYRSLHALPVYGDLKFPWFADKVFLSFSFFILHNCDLAMDQFSHFSRDMLFCGTLVPVCCYLVTAPFFV